MGLRIERVPTASVFGFVYSCLPVVVHQEEKEIAMTILIPGSSCFIVPGIAGEWLVYDANSKTLDPNPTTIIGLDALGEGLCEVGFIEPGQEQFGDEAREALKKFADPFDKNPVFKAGGMALSLVGGKVIAFYEKGVWIVLSPTNEFQFAPGEESDKSAMFGESLGEALWYSTQAELASVRNDETISYLDVNRKLIGIAARFMENPEITNRTPDVSEMCRDADITQLAHDCGVTPATDSGGSPLVLN